MKNKIIIGQEAICPDGLGRVIDVGIGSYEFIEISTYINDRSCKWGKNNVELIDPRNLKEKNK